MFGLASILGFTGVVGKILEFAPMIIDIVERLLGANEGVKKRAAAAKEVIEFVRELVEKGDDFGDFDELNLDAKAILLALEDEEVFVEKIAALNDAIVDLTNYVNSFAEEDDE